MSLRKSIKSLFFRKYKPKKTAIPSETQAEEIAKPVPHKILGKDRGGNWLYLSHSALLDSLQFPVHFRIPAKPIGCVWIYHEQYAMIFPSLEAAENFVAHYAMQKEVYIIPHK